MSRQRSKKYRQHVEGKRLDIQKKQHRKAKRKEDRHKKLKKEPSDMQGKACSSVQVAQMADELLVVEKERDFYKHCYENSVEKNDLIMERFETYQTRVSKAETKLFGAGVTIFVMGLGYVALLIERFL